MRFVDYLDLGKRLAALSPKAKPSFQTKIISRYAREDDGSMIIFGLFSFAVIMITTGIAVDVIRHETLRAELQNTLDRAVLAAANPTTELDRKEVVIDYFRAAGLSKYLNKNEITVEENGSASRVSATVTADIKTAFMWMAGVDTLPLRSNAAAAQSIGDIEISMVLDVSNSMTNKPNGIKTRLESLADAGQEFAEVVYKGGGGVSVSVVPYSMQVNAGETILSQLSRDGSHEESHCINFIQNDFSTVGITTYDGNGTPLRTYDQTLQFDVVYTNASLWPIRLPFYDSYVFEEELLYPECSPNENNKVLPFATTEKDVSDKIAALVGYANTSIDVGMKWGAALLDPSMRPAVDALIASKEVSSDMRGRPYDYPEDENGKAVSPTKFIVLMSDGANTVQRWLDSNSDTGVNYRKDSTGIVYKTDDGTVVFKSNRGFPRGKWFVPSTGRFSNSFNESELTELTWPQVLSRYSVHTYAVIRAHTWSGAFGYPYSGRGDQKIGAPAATEITDQIGYGAKDTRLQNICNATKDKGVIVFTVGFDINDNNAKNQLRNCATNSGYYYDANQANLEAAFKSIAAEISKLRLVE